MAEDKQKGPLTAMMFKNDEPEMMPTLINEGGTDFSFEKELTVPWRWQGMIAQLNEESLWTIVDGPAPTPDCKPWASSGGSSEGASSGGAIVPVRTIINCLLVCKNDLDVRRRQAAKTRV